MLDLFSSEGAVFSPCRTYRYRLVRGGPPYMAVCMLNGSTADEKANDPTVRRVLGFARREGYAGIDVVNAFGLAATDSGELFRHADPVGPDNDAHLAEVAARYDRILVAWGQRSKFPDPARETRVIELLTAHGARLWCLRRNGDGTPEHPLFIPGDAPALAFP